MTRPAAPPTGAFDAERARRELARRSEKRRGLLKVIFIVLAVLITIPAAIAGYYWWRGQSADDAEQILASAVNEPPAVGGPRVRELLEDGRLSGRQIVVAARYLATAPEAASVPALIAALSGPSEARRIAAEALARIGPPAALPARDPLSTALGGATPDDAVAIAWALASLGDRRGLDRSVDGLATGALLELESWDPGRLALLLGRQGLAGLLRHEHPAVRTFAATWLGSMCDESVIASLSAAAQDADRGVVVAACVSLARCGGDQARTVIASVNARDPAFEAPLLDAFASDVGAPGLAILLAQRSAVADRTAVVERLAGLHDPRATDALLPEWGRTPAAESAYRRMLMTVMGESGAPELKDPARDMLGSRRPEDVTAGVAALGASGLGEEVQALLTDALRRRRNIGGEVLRAMGEAGVCTDYALERVRAAANDRATEAPALVALGRCKHREAAELALRLLERIGRTGGEPLRPEDAERRLAAYDALVRVRFPNASAVVLDTVLDPTDDGAMRGAAADALGAIGDDASLERMLGLALEPGTPEVDRALAMRALRHRLPASALPRLVVAMRGDDERAPLAAELVGLHFEPAVAGDVARLLDDAGTRRPAAIAASYGGDDAIAGRLAALLRTDRELEASVREHVRTRPLVLTEAGWETGRIYGRVEQLVRLRDAGQPDLLAELGRTLAGGSMHMGGLTLHEVRRAFARDLEGQDARKRRLAAEALLAMGARGALLARRDAGGPGADEAAATLLPR